MESMLTAGQTGDCCNGFHLVIGSSWQDQHQRRSRQAWGAEQAEHPFQIVVIEGRRRLGTYQGLA